jgi:HTH-like domain
VRSCKIAHSSFCAWLDGKPRRAERAAADAELAERNRVVHGRDRTQGARRITGELNDGAPPVARVNHKRVARVMREHGITGLRLRHRVRTTVPEPADQKVPDLLHSGFTADAPNQRYVGDITYLPLDDGPTWDRRHVPGVVVHVTGLIGPLHRSPVHRPIGVRRGAPVVLRAVSGQPLSGRPRADRRETSAAAWVALAGPGRVAGASVDPRCARAQRSSAPERATHSSADLGVASTHPEQAMPICR